MSDAVFKNFTLGGELGKGGMATVFGATDNNTGRKVAIKFLLPAIASDKGFVSQFVEEFRANTLLRHANIVETIEGGEHQGRYFMVMELLDGGSLKELLAAGKRPPIDLTVHIIINVLKGLQHSHQCGIVHQDMKPANLMIQQDGSVKIADFGISRIASPAAWAPSGKIRGTPAYMSPEQAGGKEPTYLWDIFSTGVVFYELLAGFNPFGARDPQAALKKIIGENPPPLVKTLPTVSHDLELVLAKMLEKDPKKRYQNAHSVLGDLQRVTAKLQFAYSQDLFRQFLEQPDSMRQRMSAHRSLFHLAQSRKVLAKGKEWAELGAWEAYRAALLDRQSQDAAAHLQTVAKENGFTLQSSGSMDLQALEKKLAEEPSDISLLLQIARVHKVERNPVQTCYFARMALSLAPGDAGVVASVEKVLGRGRVEYL